MTLRANWEATSTERRIKSMIIQIGFSYTIKENLITIPIMKRVFNKHSETKQWIRHYNNWLWVVPATEDSQVVAYRQLWSNCSPSASKMVPFSLRPLLQIETTRSRITWKYMLQSFKCAKRGRFNCYICRNWHVELYKNDSEATEQRKEWWESNLNWLLSIFKASFGCA